MVPDAGLPLRELQLYVQRVSDRWPIERAHVAAGEPCLVVLVSPGFDGVPWLERVYQCGALWDASEMGAPADVHCYTPAELERKRMSLRRVRETVEQGLDLMAETPS